MGTATSAPSGVAARANRKNAAGPMAWEMGSRREAARVKFRFDALSPGGIKPEHRDG
jgi:hypothetical protein